MSAEGGSGVFGFAFLSRDRIRNRSRQPRHHAERVQHLLGPGLILLTPLRGRESGLRLGVESVDAELRRQFRCTKTGDNLKRCHNCDTLVSSRLVETLRVPEPARSSRGKVQ